MEQGQIKQEKQDNKADKRVNVILQARDLKILEFLAKFGVANERHIRQLIGLDEESMSNYIRIIRKLTLADYVEKQRLIAGEYAYLLLGERGASLLGTRRVKNLVLNTLRHDMLVLDVYFDIMAKNPDAQVMSERELRIETGFKVGAKKKLPDLLVDGKIAIEMELSEKSHARLVEIIGNYVRNSQMEEVRYFVRSRTLGLKILEFAGWHKKFKVFLLDVKSKNLAYSEISNAAATVKDVPVAAAGFDLDEYLQP